METCLCCNNTRQCLGIQEQANGTGCDCKSFDDCPTLGLCACGVLDDFNPIQSQPTAEQKQKVLRRFAQLVECDRPFS